MTMETFEDAISDDRFVLVDFYATWCQPCQMMHPVLEQVKAVLGDKLRIIKVDVDKRRITAARHGVRSIPTLVLMRGGKELWRQSGAMSKADLLAALEPLLK